MGRRSKSKMLPEIQPPYPCYFGCGRNLQSKYDQAAKGWTWFTGYGEHPVHFCLPCQRTRQYEIERIREKLDVKPEGYPAVRAKL